MCAFFFVDGCCCCCSTECECHPTSILTHKLWWFCSMLSSHNRSMNQCAIESFFDYMALIRLTATFDNSFLFLFFSSLLSLSLESKRFMRNLCGLIRGRFMILLFLQVNTTLFRACTLHRLGVVHWPFTLRCASRYSDSPITTILNGTRVN